MVYRENCGACHGANGEGKNIIFPPLAASDYVNANPKRAIEAVVKGINGKIVVNGRSYDSVMPAIALDDAQVVNVMMFILNSWGNVGGDVSSLDVAAARR